MLRTLLSYLIHGTLLLLGAAVLLYFLVGFMIPEREEKLYLNPMNWCNHTAPPAAPAHD